MSRDASRLVDRLVAGERLSPEETRHLEELARVDPECARELELLDQLEGFVEGEPEAPSAAAIAIAHAALARVAAGEVGPRPAPVSRRWPSLRTLTIVGGSLAAALVAVLAWPDPPLPPDPAPVVAEARLTIAAGEVTIDGRAIGDAMIRIESATTIAVRHGRACLAIDPRIDVCLDETTTAMVQGLADAQTTVEVLRGHVVARLDPLPAGRSFALAGADVRAVAVGTMFSLEVADDGSTVTAAVLDGVVEVVTADTTVRLGAHEVVRLSAGGLVRDRLSADAEARELELLATAPALDGAIGHVAIEVAPPGASVLIDDRPFGASPVLAALPVGEHRLELRGADGARLGETLVVREGTLLPRRFALSGADAPKPADEPPALVDDEDVDIEVDDVEDRVVERPRAPVSSPRELLAEARQLRRDDRWADAAAAYRTLVREHPRSSEAHTALVSLGDLLLDRLDQPEQAARAYLRYVRGGGGVLAPEARWGIIRARRQQGDGKAERRAIDDFLRHHPDDARAQSLR